MQSLYKQILPKGLWPILQTIQSQSEFSNFYLAGGTALALQIGHRVSIDLDFFTPKQFDTSLISAIQYKHQVMSLSKNSIEIIIDNNKIFFFYFAFPLLDPPILIDGIHLANGIDIGLMKLLALQGRTTKKDIIDLYYIDKKILKLENLLKLFESHYPKESFNAYSSLKTLLNIDELNSQPMPKMTEALSWQVAFDLVSTKIIRHLDTILKKNI
jgi:predicted nucleotidyltransferase component of viral defense system